MIIERLKNPIGNSPGNQFRIHSIFTSGEIICILNALKKHGTAVSKDITSKLVKAIKNTEDKELLELTGEHTSNSP